MILKIIPDIGSGVFSVKWVVSPYALLSQLFYSFMIISENPQHTLNIHKLQMIVRLIILLTTICTIVRICMH